jgi:hypothetical protein
MFSRTTVPPKVCSALALCPIYPFYCLAGSCLVSRKLTQVVTGSDRVQPTLTQSPPTSESETPSTGYSTSDKIALGTGIGIGLPGLLITVLGIYRVWNRRR